MPSIAPSLSDKEHKYLSAWKPPRQPFHLDSAYIHYERLHQQHSLKQRPRFRDTLKSRKDGLLSNFMSMPVDILYEVVSHLHPQDVLNLSRSTRRLRQLLMTRNARFVWKCALSNVEGLPSCPPDLSEPQYANLAFDEHCHHCLAPGVKDVLWSCRVRSCKDCLSKCFLTTDQLAILLSKTLDLPQYETIFLHIVYPINSDNAETILFYKPAAEAYIRELTAFNEDDKRSLSRWCKKKRMVLDRIMSHANLCQHWSNYWAYSEASHQYYDVGLTICLLGLLVFLWKDKLF